METPGKSPEGVREKFTRTIHDAPDSITAEMARTPNDWFSCFGSVVFTLENRLFVMIHNEELTIDEGKAKTETLERIKARLHELGEQYGETKNPPGSVTTELLGMLQELL